MNAYLLDALAAICHLPQNIEQPAWIGEDSASETGSPVHMVRGPNQCGLYTTLVSTANGLLDVHARTLHPHDPCYFNLTSVPYDYRAGARAPLRWLAFLDDLWPAPVLQPTLERTADHADRNRDSLSVRALQEWFGYVISGRTDLHKILLVVGPTRGGKGATMRVLGGLIGAENVAGPTLASLKTNFGLAPLIGKSLAVISDARAPGRDSGNIAEILLAVSGEDLVTVDRKYRDQYTGKLPCRFAICSNELPRLGDASAAIAGRFVTLLPSQSWLGKEDPNLERDLAGEMPGILNWALDGLQRLEEQGRFSRPESTDIAFRQLQDLSSPVGAFIRDRCMVGPEREVAVEELWAAWKAWAEDNGHGKGGTKQMFGRDLRATVPAVQLRRPRTEGDDRVRVYSGVALRDGSDIDEDADLAEVERLPIAPSAAR